LGSFGEYDEGHVAGLQLKSMETEDDPFVTMVPKEAACWIEEALSAAEVVADSDEVELKSSASGES